VGAGKGRGFQANYFFSKRSGEVIEQKGEGQKKGIIPRYVPSFYLWLFL